MAVVSNDPSSVKADKGKRDRISNLYTFPFPELKYKYFSSMSNAASRALPSTLKDARLCFVRPQSNYTKSLSALSAAI